MTRLAVIRRALALAGMGLWWWAVHAADVHGLPLVGLILGEVLAFTAGVLSARRPARRPDPGPRAEKEDET